jgi:thiamine transporter
MKKRFESYFLEASIIVVFVLLSLLSFVAMFSISSGGETVSLSLFEVIFSTSIKVGSANVDFSSFNAVMVLVFILYLLSVTVYASAELNREKKPKIAEYLYVIPIVFILIDALILQFSGFIFSLTATGLDGLEVSDTYEGFSLTYLIFDLLLVFFLFNKLFAGTKYTIREMSETAMLIALAVVLDKFAKIPIQANGGSISLSAVPLFIIALRYGVLKGFLATSFIFGIITCLLDGYGLATFPFDYFVALSGYALIGLIPWIASFFTKEEGNKEFLVYFIVILIMGLPIMIVRYIGHMISGAILYQPITFLDNFIYQSTYVPGSVWVSIAVILILSKPIMMIDKMFPKAAK